MQQTCLPAVRNSSLPDGGVGVDIIKDMMWPQRSCGLAAQRAKSTMCSVLERGGCMGEAMSLASCNSGSLEVSVCCSSLLIAAIGRSTLHGSQTRRRDVGGRDSLDCYVEGVF